ncbi:MAG: YggS family pyridoxal phosphate-dependent enzyme [Anaerolineaceae bacterium]|nr:YggS family pyridoxal phosphate-dependent enzyme [Anaerolineaceae bacterium]
MTISEHIQRVQEQITTACARAGRDPSEVTLVAVSKTHPAAAVLAAVEAGLQHFGENRVEEASEKLPVVNQQVSAPLTWHMIGHVQSRKAKLVLPLFDVVHSVDSVKLAEKFSMLAGEQGQTLDILLEVNVSGEASKYGFEASGWERDAAVREAFIQQVAGVNALPGLRLRGLMTMAPIMVEAEQTRPVFASLAGLRATLVEALTIELPELSMGMTDDYPVAIEEGATLVRIGRAIFGERN